ncbi:MAG: PD-(D/E)XK nuclease family protein, partial [Lachnospiraceae bacterium]|nr:PD-(D/E)XK nuclease family protein [Lachnospiraceae bacterium]
IYSNIMIELAGSKGRLDGVTDETAISPDGMYYYRMKDPYIEISKEDELEAKRAKELDLVGMDNDGSGDFEAVLKYADSKAKSLAMEILDGHIEKNPLNEGERSACDYCPYSACCRFDSKYGGNSYKRLKYKNTKADADIICAEIKANMDLKGKEAAD